MHSAWVDVVQECWNYATITSSNYSIQMVVPKQQSMLGEYKHQNQIDKITVPIYFSKVTFYTTEEL